LLFLSGPTVDRSQNCQVASIFSTNFLKENLQNEVF
jgi:hypothetical protein